MALLGSLDQHVYGDWISNNHYKDKLHFYLAAMSAYQGLAENKVAEYKPIVKQWLSKVSQPYKKRNYDPDKTFPELKVYSLSVAQAVSPKPTSKPEVTVESLIGSLRAAMAEARSIRAVRELGTSDLPGARKVPESQAEASVRDRTPAAIGVPRSAADAMTSMGGGDTRKLDDNKPPPP